MKLYRWALVATMFVISMAMGFTYYCTGWASSLWVSGLAFGSGVVMAACEGFIIPWMERD